MATRDALVLASVPGSIRLTKAMWARLDSVFFKTGPRRWLAKFVKDGIGADVATTVGKGSGRRQVVVPKWTAKGVRHLREFLLNGERQRRILKDASELALKRIGPRPVADDLRASQGVRS